MVHGAWVVVNMGMDYSKKREGENIKKTKAKKHRKTETEVGDLNKA
jgi:hypothetical protein